MRTRLTDRLDANPYGTPTSLSLISPQEPIPGDQLDSSEIPDSPTGRVASGAFGATFGLDREGTKSESPELGDSVHSVPPTDSGNALAEQIHIDVPASNPSPNPPIATSTSQSGFVERIGDGLAATDNCDTPQRTENVSTPLQPSSKRKYPSADTTFAETRQQFDGLQPESDTILDPIESEGENLDKQQPVQTGKRRKHDLATPVRFASPRVAAGVGDQRRDGSFLTPSLPKSSSSKARTPLGENAAPLRDDILTHVDGNRSGEAHGQYSHQRPKEQAPRNEKEKELSAPLLSSNHGRSERKVVDLRNQNLAKGAEEQEQQRTVDVEVEQQRIADVAMRKQKAAEEKDAEARRAAQKETPEREVEANRLTEVRKTKEEQDRAKKLAEAERVRQAKAKEEEIAKVKAAVEARAKEQEIAQELKLAEEKETTERQAREKTLKGQAEKVMQAADGAKQLEAEKLKKTKPTATSNGKVETTAAPKTPITYAKTDLQKARRTELSEKKKADKAKAAEEENEREASRTQRSAQKLADSNANAAKKAWESSQRITKSNSEEAEKSSKRTQPHSEEEATLNGKSRVKVTLQKLRDLSEDRGRQSSTPSEQGTNTGHPRKSMTPAIPKSSATKSASSVQEDLLSSSPLASRFSRNNDIPLRSALKQSNSALRRSVSFIDDAGPTLPNPLPVVASDGCGSRPIKTLVEINKELTDAAPAASKTSYPMPARNGSITASSKKPPAKGKVQTKLNVTRDKKMKGRVLDPPSSPKPVPEKQIVLSSSEVDDIWSVSFSDEDLDQNGTAKDGLTSKKPIFRGNSSSVKGGSTPVSALSNIDPSLQKIKVEKGTIATSASVSRSSSRSISSSQEKSSRSPAQATSGTLSLSSGSSSDSDSDSALESELNKDSSEIPSNMRNGDSAPVRNRGVSNATKVEVSSSLQDPKRRGQVPQQSKAPTTESSTALINGSAKRVDQAADKQLKRECRDSIPKDAKQIAASSDIPADEGPASRKFPPLDRSGRLPDGTRPAYYRYPTLTQLKQMAESNEPYQVPPQKAETAAMKESESISSSDDESTSHLDEDDEDFDRDAAVSVSGSQTTPNTKSGGGFPGLKGVMKRKSRSDSALSTARSR